MPHLVLDAARRPAQLLGRKIRKSAEEGCDVVLEMGATVRPARILKVIKATVGSYRVKLVVRHAELREYIEKMLKGALIGRANDAVLVTPAALAAGNPATHSAVLTGVKNGAVVGMIISLGRTSIALITIYKIGGETRMRFEAA